MGAASNIATARRLLAKNGEPVLVRYTAGAVVDPATGDETVPGSSVELTGNGYTAKYKNSDVDGSNVRMGDVQLVVEKLDQRPQKGWDCTVDSVTYRIMDVDPIRQEGTDVIYMLQLRAA